MHMQRHRFLLSLLCTISLFHLWPTPAAAFPWRAIQLKNIEFIRANCETTSYPEICHSSLVPYAHIVGQSPVRLVGVAIAVCQYSRTKPLMAYIYSLSRGGSGDPGIVRALQQCSVVLNSAVEELEESLGQMRKLRSGADIAHLQLGVSSALDDIEDCIDDFEYVSDESEKSSVIYWTTEVMKFTSIVMDLVEKLRASD